jgi:glycogen phosphorylase
MTGTRYTLEVQPRIPQRIDHLSVFANDLLYSWDRQVRGLFFRLDRELWEACRHNPKVFLRRVAQQRLDEAAADRIFMEDYNRVLSVYRTYHQEQTRTGVERILDRDDLVAYFCAEFGFHESLPIYSGGLGILAGDHCKAASDLGVPFVAVGMLYRQGYFTQTIDGHGSQITHYTPTDFADLPIAPALGPDGEEIHVRVDFPGRQVTIKVWKAKAGHISLYLLDTDLPANSEPDRSITYQLYGGDVNTRIQQELVLGIGGVRALRALGLQPTVWHINEGHAAFMILERCREQVVQSDRDFAAALELVAAGTVFTTHTPVSAGHDIFDHALMRSYFASFVEALGIEWDEFLRIGASPGNENAFNQTALALRGSRFHNGVSRIHGNVASHMEAYVWPQIPPEENPITHITNGVHVPTFLAREWANLFDMRFGGEWRNELLSDEYWRRIDELPDHSYWSLRQSLKGELLENVRRRAVLQHRRNGCSEAQIERITRNLSPLQTDILTLGFARRFATYKRASLIFADPARLARLLNDPQRPVIMIFAGKAHPHDLPGQHLIQVVHEYSRRPEFEGRIILLEGYDLALGRKLVTGVDVWLNTPEYPLEASGTSGQKAGINGVVNLSVLDGWWGEGYNGENGWAITPHGPQYDAGYRNHEEAHELMHLLEHQVVPLYYGRNSHGYSEGWVKTSKASMRSIMPHFNAQRMVMDYVRKFYGPASRQRRALSEHRGAPARELAQWKRKITRRWPSVRIRRVDAARQEIQSGETLPIEVAAFLNGIDATDVVVECLVGTETESGDFQVHDCVKLSPTDERSAGELVFRLDLCPTLPGLQFYKLRMYPYHPLLTHPFEMGCMVWL